MDNMKKFEEMFKLQQKLNDETNGAGWEEGYNKHGKIINWRRCIHMECAELIDSFSWKHWKNIDKAPDWENVKVEIVDIWHFVMSFGLEEYRHYEKDRIEKILKIISEDESCDEFCNDEAQWNFKRSTEVFTPDPSNAIEIINLAEHLIHTCTGYENDMFEKIVGEFFVIAQKCGLCADELYKFYVAKNILNKFRQDNGYKSGHYIKNWDGREDNEIMLQILKDSPHFSPDEVYEALGGLYEKIKK